MKSGPAGDTGGSGDIISAWKESERDGGGERERGRDSEEKVLLTMVTGRIMVGTQAKLLYIQLLLALLFYPVLAFSLSVLLPTFTGFFLTTFSLPILPSSFCLPPSIPPSLPLLPLSLHSSPPSLPPFLSLSPPPPPPSSHSLSPPSLPPHSSLPCVPIIALLMASSHLRGQRSNNPTTITSNTHITVQRCIQYRL